MPTSRTLLRGAVAAALALPAAAVAGNVDATLRARLAAAKGNEPVAVIVSVADKVDPRNYRASDRRARNPELVKALKAKAAATQGPVLALLQNADDVRILWAVNAVAARVPPQLVDVLARLPGVDRVYPDLLAAPPDTTLTPNSTPEANLAMLRAPDAWAMGATGAGVVIANMDTGVDAQHPDLAARWRGGANSWYDPSAQHATPYDAAGHGTQAMGLSVGGDAGGTAIGVAPDARWIAVKIYDDAGVSSYSRIHQGFQWLLDPDGNPDTNDSPDVASLSWGLVGTAGTCITEFDADIALLKASGIAVAVAAGNDGPGAGTSLSPANNASAFSVGAVDTSGVIASFSARGPSACGGGIFPHIVAPGANVNTADLSFGGLPFYTSVTGTSFAAPQVAGILALLAGAFPAASIAELEDAITATAVDAGTAGADNAYGAGIADAAAAYARLASTQAPSPTITSAPATTVLEGATYSYAVIASDPGGGTLTYSLPTAPAGMAIDGASGVITWTPTHAQVGANAVTVKVANAAGRSASQSFVVTVQALNTAPTARDDAYTMKQGATLSVAAPGLLANDSDAEGNTLSAALVASPAHGTLALQANGGFTYTPVAAYSGTDTFSYRASDGKLASNPATVTVRIDPNTAPVAKDDAVTVAARVAGRSYTPVAIAVLANDTDAEGNIDPATVAITTAPGKGGTATVNANGTVSYTPKAGFKGVDSFRYRVRDKLGATSNNATVTVTVQ